MPPTTSTEQLFATLFPTEPAPKERTRSGAEVLRAAVNQINGCREGFLDKYTAHELVNLCLAWQASEWDIYPDGGEWLECQIAAAVKDGTPPKWTGYGNPVCAAPGTCVLCCATICPGLSVDVFHAEELLSNGADADGRTTLYMAPLTFPPVDDAWAFYLVNSGGSVLVAVDGAIGDWTPAPRSDVAVALDVTVDELEEAMVTAREERAP